MDIRDDIGLHVKKTLVKSGKEREIMDEIDVNISKFYFHQLLTY